ncbi:Xanthine and CO dehydrogenase maturation factor, XdhC/CoxF family [Maribacter sedimenticola]|uniref:Xanthine and CO dehydrogenase maturation factor, XdhC/CoxF family n=1 Tax=Maribacter sedimenticola TaxID=228956 RepID=A0ABY1SGR5_9FLAO|nr:XdhC family protein [Maribacter sedimenticola]SNR46861.1 Xanthine and CO dehydrogenase maturation factor, XdhC/CoxF family [Maribacter sedimenticola]
MTHELKTIFNAYELAKEENVSCVLATVVFLEGSSYRKPGVRMLIREDDTMIGAVSGGCVEKEVLFQSQSVFKDHSAKLMTYDGRFRLGCEGILYIMLEIFSPNESLVHAFKKVIENRMDFTLSTTYEKEYGQLNGYGTFITLGAKTYPLNPYTRQQSNAHSFEQKMPPCKRLLLIGGEHDAVQLAHFGVSMGWEVRVAVTPQENKSILDFKGIDELLNYEPELFPVEQIDEETAVVLMTHSFAKDLKYLMALKNVKPMYLGVLGPIKRREKLLDHLLEQDMDISVDFLESIHGPAGLNIGAETPQEIAISILAEILTVIRKTEPMMLKNRAQKPV